jgi:hypothetical protein
MRRGAGAGHVERQREQRRLVERNDPRNGEEQCNPAASRQGQAERAGPRLLFFRELARQDREEHDVVDAQHDLEQGERRQGGHGVERQQLFHSFFLSNC